MSIMERYTYYSLWKPPIYKKKKNQLIRCYNITSRKNSFESTWLLKRNSCL